MWSRFLLISTCLAVIPAAQAVRGLLEEPDLAAGGKTWALLIAGSNGFGNYRHQADVYHAYQIVKKGGIPDENIVVMHYDDIANNDENPHPGKVINKPGGPDVYAGVPKDYTGEQVTAANMLAVLAGDAEAMRGVGSGKVISSSANDRVFMYYADHGGPGILGVPSGAGPYLYAKDLIKTLKTKAASGFKEMVLYIEACESGSMLDGLLPDNINIYATTASNPSESSWGYYCPGMTIPPPKEYMTCLGDLYSISFLEDLDKLTATKPETYKKQYTLVKKRTSQNGTYDEGSHVMQYGDLAMDKEKLRSWFALSSAADEAGVLFEEHPEPAFGGVEQRDADLLYFQTKYERAQGEAKSVAKNALDAEKARRYDIDQRVAQTALKMVAGDVEKALQLKIAMRPEGQGLVEDWDCFKGMIEAYEAGCGVLGDYGIKHARMFANMCNNGKTVADMQSVVGAVCSLRATQ
ncbi:hypothetical protein CYMTET_40537 [Cymbomonas tetramitiformis]|uniref:legumain n=1 Tax=Cymbomonas tetramitiformis TaxID=36881 RepID=A0AAE0C7V1_9CHLO|nr:hypothetical protein CYMTET_40537 [Cymbomonas tetramitiformis]